MWESEEVGLGSKYRVSRELERHGGSSSVKIYTRQGKNEIHVEDVHLRTHRCKNLAKCWQRVSKARSENRILEQSVNVDKLLCNCIRVCACCEQLAVRE